MKANLSLTNRNGFSLVEVLAAVGIIGIIAFLAIPNIVAIKDQSEKDLAISKAQALNMAIASYIQANGREVAETDYNIPTTDALRYKKLTPYMAFAPDKLSDYEPNGYTFNLPDDLASLSPTTIQDADDNDVPY